VAFSLKLEDFSGGIADALPERDFAAKRGEFFFQVS
jgi:hypothetical protein